MEATSTKITPVPRGLRVETERVTRNQVRAKLEATIDWYTLWKAGVLDCLVQFNEIMDSETGPDSGDAGDVPLF